MGGLVTVIVAMPIPSPTVPATDTFGPMKFNCVIDPAIPTIFPSSLTVIPSKETAGGTGIQYLCAYPGIDIGKY
jgi:hypothetical protein